jgi:hypothetical protein
VCTENAEGQTFIHAHQAKTVAGHIDPTDSQFDVRHFIAVQNHNTFKHKPQPDVNPEYFDDNGPSLPHHLGSPLISPPPPPPQITEPCPTAPQSGVDRGFLDTVEEKQDEIRDDREKLVGVRFRLRTRRHELRVTREDAAVKAGNAISRVKSFLLQQGLELPQDIQTALDDADTSRDILGIQETEYEEAEEKHNLEEWLYTQKESKFVDDLLSTNQSSLITVNPVTDPSSQARRSHDYLLAGNFDHVPPMSQVVSREEGPTHDVVGPHGSNQNAQSGNLAAVHRGPEPLQRALGSMSLVEIPTQTAYSIEPFMRSQSENDLNLARQKWSQTRDRIDEWMLEAVDNSKLQKAHLRNQLSQPNINDNDWWKLVVRYWHSTSPSLSAFHTGDTTIPASSTSKQVSETTLQKPFEDFDLVGTDDGPCTATPLVQDDRHMDALEEVNFPSDIKLSEMFGRTPKYVTFGTRPPSAQSLSTQRTIETHASSETDSTSVSSYSVKCVPQSGYIPTWPQVQSQTPTSRTEYQLEKNPRDVNCALDHSNLTTIATRSIGDVAPASRKKHVRHTNEPPPTKAARSLGTGMACTSMTRSHTRHPYPLYIKVEGPKPWNLPLLRLTPLPSPFFPDFSSGRIVQHFCNTPFVSISGNPIRLPGPSNLP